jgi:hypothetical protein
LDTRELLKLVMALLFYLKTRAFFGNWFR